MSKAQMASALFEKQRQEKIAAQKAESEDAGVHAGADEGPADASQQVGIVPLAMMRLLSSPPVCTSCFNMLADMHFSRTSTNLLLGTVRHSAPSDRSELGSRMGRQLSCVLLLSHDFRGNSVGASVRVRHGDLGTGAKQSAAGGSAERASSTGVSPVQTHKFSGNIFTGVASFVSSLEGFLSLASRKNFSLWLCFVGFLLWNSSVALL